MKLLSRFRSLFNHQDLTQGSPWKGILLFLLPILLSTLFQQLYTVADAAIVGQALRQESVAAVNASGSIHFIVLNFGMGCASGFSVILSKHVGAKNVNEAKRSFLAQIILCIIASVFITVIGILSIKPLLGLLGITPSDTDAAMNLEYQEATTYLTTLFGAALLVVFYNMSVANLRAKGDSFAPFLFLMSGVLLNIGLDYLFIYAFKMGVAGTALATVLAEGVACVFALIYGTRKYDEFRIDIKNLKPTFKDLLNHAKNGFPLGIQFSVLGFGIIAMTSAVVAFDIYPDGSTVAGLPAQIGYGAACKIINFLFAPLSSLGTATLSYVSQNYGAKNRERLQKGVNVAIIIGLIISTAMCGVGFLLTINGAYQHFFLSSEKISDASIFYGNSYLYISIPFLFAIMMLFILRNALQGLEKPFFPFLAGVIELVARIFVCSILPRLIYTKLSANSPVEAFYLIASGDIAAWVSSFLVMLVPALFFLRRVYRNEEPVL